MIFKYVAKIQKKAVIDNRFIENMSFLILKI